MQPAHCHKNCAMGNDILVLDPRVFPLDATPENVRLICDRHHGVGADGVCCGRLPGSAQFAMRYYNPDGSLAEMSGNGLRVFARYLRDQGYAAGGSFMIATGGRACQADILDQHGERIRIAMGRAAFKSEQFLTPAEDSEADIKLNAAACVAIRKGYCASPVTEEMPGGAAIVEADENWDVWLRGSVSPVFSGNFAPGFLEGLS